MLKLSDRSGLPAEFRGRLLHTWLGLIKRQKLVAVLLKEEWQGDAHLSHINAFLHLYGVSVPKITAWWILAALIVVLRTGAFVIMGGGA